MFTRTGTSSISEAQSSAGMHTQDCKNKGHWGFFGHGQRIKYETSNALIAQQKNP